MKILSKENHENDNSKLLDESLHEENPSEFVTTYDSLLSGIPDALETTYNKMKSKRTRMAYGTTSKLILHSIEQGSSLSVGEEIRRGQDDQAEILKVIHEDFELNNKSNTNEKSIMSNDTGGDDEKDTLEDIDSKSLDHDSRNDNVNKVENHSATQEELVLDTSQTTASEEEMINLDENNESNHENSEETLVFDSSQTESNVYVNEEENRVNNPTEHASGDGVAVPSHRSDKSHVTSNRTENAHEEVNNSLNDSEITDEEPPSTSQTEPQVQKLPSDEDIIQLTDDLFVKADKDSVTVGDINRSIEIHFNIKLPKKKKKMVKARLMDLISEKETPEPNLGNENEIDTPPLLENEQEIEEDFESQSGDEEKEEEKEEEEWEDDSYVKPKQRKSKRSKRNRRHLLKANYLLQKQKDMEKVMQEEIAAAALDEKKQQTEEDLRRMENIRKKFEIDTEEALQTRFEDRLGLLDKLKRKRIEVISLDDEELDEKKVEYANDSNLEKEDLKKRVESENEEKTVGDRFISNTSKIIEHASKDASSDDSSSDESDEDELEIIVPSKKQDIATSLLQTKSPAKKRNMKKVSNARHLLRQDLRNKSIHAGNNWLARELGYENEEEHILDCLRTEKKRRIVLNKEEEKSRKLLEKNSLLFKDYAVGTSQEGEGEDEEKEWKEEEEEEEENNDKEITSEELDEEMLMAKEIEAEALQKTQSKENVNEEIIEKKVNTLSSNAETDMLQTESSQNTISVHKSENDVIMQEKQNSNVIKEDGITSNDKDNEEFEFETQEFKQDSESVKSMENHSPETSDEMDNAPKIRNAGWQELLKKDAQSAKKRTKSTLVETEADEEEEEDAVLGLEDFGFSTIKAKNDDEEDEKNLQARDDDLNHVVDELSDGEGDEEAGEIGRKAMLANEEKEKHKEIIRRMRDGYDGRRGGIGGGSARGIYRFDQITAAENRSDAKRLGLLNDDEMDSDEEAEPIEEKEVDDEHALLDQMLKDRFLNRRDQHIFSDEEDEEEETVENTGENVEEVDKEEVEQERMAKIFSKRARMNRLLSLYDGETEFSQSRLIEDKSFSQDLKNIKCLFTDKKRQASATSNSSTSSASKNIDTSRALFRRQNSLSTPLSRSSSLSLSIGSKSRSRKRKTTFLNIDNNMNKNKGKDNAHKSLQRSVSLSHVVFHNSDAVPSQKHSRNNKRKNACATSKTQSMSKHSTSSADARRKRSNVVGGLWSKVSQSRFSSY